MMESKITPGSTFSEVIPVPSEPQNNPDDGGAHISAQDGGPLETESSFVASDPVFAPENLRLHVAMTFGENRVYMKALELDISAEDKTAPGVFRRLVEAVREELITSNNPRSELYTELLNYPPLTWFRFVPPEQPRWHPERQGDAVTEQETGREKVTTEENALHDFDIPDLDALAEAQGVEPIGDIDELVADFWPEDESVEDFMAAVRRWRDEGHHQHS